MRLFGVLDIFFWIEYNSSGFAVVQAPTKLSGGKKMTTTQGMIRDALRSAETAEPGIQPAILMHRNIDHDKVAEYTSCYVNDSWTSKLKELIDGGWIVFRIQSEFGINGHETHAYLAKMKTN